MNKRVIEFMNRDMNSAVVPDEKLSKKKLQYRLSSLELRHEKFLAENCDVDISYTQFTRHMSSNIIKPKPENWGTSLCMPCINMEFKVSCIKQNLPIKLI